MYAFIFSVMCRFLSSVTFETHQGKHTHVGAPADCYKVDAVFQADADDDLLGNVCDNNDDR